MGEYYKPRFDKRMAEGANFGREMKVVNAIAVWTPEDTKRAIISSLVPGAISFYAFATFSKDRNAIEWWNASRKPNWAPKNPLLYGAMDIATMAPLGYASYLVYKHGGGLEYNDTKLALALYGGSMVFTLLTIPLVKRRNYLCLFRNTLFMHLTSLGAAITSYKIDHNAGLLMAPFAIWTGFYTLLTYEMSKVNTSEASACSTL